MKNLDKIKQDFLKTVRPELSDMSYNTWFIPIDIKRIDDEIKTVYMTAENDFAANILRSRYFAIIEDSLRKVLKAEYKVVIKTAESYRHEDEEIERVNEISNNESITAQPGGSFRKQRIAHPEYTFDNFVVGSGNKYAHAAALAVAESPSQAYNPLFIYGGSGLGKTHLMHAIAIYLSEHRPELNVLYVSSEMFTNELIKALGENKQREFKNKYRKVDVLLIDDIQFLENKETTQEEFFHTFNDLYDLNKQIVITSDRPPNELTTLEERLRSRFSWNMIAGLSPSDYETRVAIIKNKIENKDAYFPDDVVDYIASNIKSNIRSIEGAINKLIAYSNLENTDITIDNARDLLDSIISPDKPKEITPQLIIEVVCEHYGVTIEQLISKNRSQNIIRPRHVAMYLCTQETDCSQDTIAKLLDRKDHSTIINARDNIIEQLKTDKELQNQIDTIKKKINSN